MYLCVCGCLGCGGGGGGGGGVHVGPRVDTEATVLSPTREQQPNNDIHRSTRSEGGRNVFIPIILSTVASALDCSLFLSMNPYTMENGNLKDNLVMNC